MAKEKETGAVSQQDEPTMASVMDKLAAILASGQQTQQKAMEQARPKSVDTHGISAFNPRGQKDYPMPELKCEILAPWLLKPGLHGCDREEVELFNLLEPGEFTLELHDGSRRTVCVVGTKNTQTGQLEQLALAGAYDPETKHHGALFTKEDRQNFPAMRVILRSLLAQQGADVSHVLPMHEEIARTRLPESHPDRLLVSVTG